MDKPKRNTAASKAVKAAGGSAAMARSLKTSQQVIQYWLKAGVPAQHCIAVEKACSGVVSRYKLRPDIFGPAP
jgi:DNA-binding transcriptional regulator YdaS (Cro superfamily)